MAGRRQSPRALQQGASSLNSSSALCIRPPRQPSQAIQSQSHDTQAHLCSAAARAKVERAKHACEEAGCNRQADGRVGQHALQRQARAGPLRLILGVRAAALAHAVSGGLHGKGAGAAAQPPAIIVFLVAAEPRTPGAVEQQSWLTRTKAGLRLFPAR